MTMVMVCPFRPLPEGWQTGGMPNSQHRHLWGGGTEAKAPIPDRLRPGEVMRTGEARPGGVEGAVADPAHLRCVVEEEDVEVARERGAGSAPAPTPFHALAPTPAPHAHDPPGPARTPAPGRGRGGDTGAPGRGEGIGEAGKEEEGGDPALQSTRGPKRRLQRPWPRRLPPPTWHPLACRPRCSPSTR